MAAVHPPREKVLADFKAEIAASNGIDDGLGLFMPPAPPSQAAYLPCTKPVDSLKPMLITNMKAKRHHRGRMLFARVCAPPAHRLSALCTVVEDEAGTAVPLSVFNMPAKFAAQATATLPEGTVCLIKEPFLKSVKKKDACTIRVDHVTDILFLHETDNRIPNVWRTAPTSSSSQVRPQGNSHVQEKNWAFALNS